MRGAGQGDSRLGDYEHSMRKAPTEAGRQTAVMNLRILVATSASEWFPAHSLTLAATWCAGPFTFAGSRRG